VTIVVEDFHKVYGETVAVAGICFTVAPGEILGLAGPNGAGKTTTLRALTGILQPTRGRLSIAGYDLATQAVQAKSQLAYVPDDPHLFDRLTVWEHFRFTARAYQFPDWEPGAEALLERLELTEKRSSLASELSRGMRQKVAIGCGFLHQPRAVLLDEPLTGLDPKGIRTMKAMIREQAADGVAFIVSSHLLSLLEDLATMVLIVRRGRVLGHSTLAELRKRVAGDDRQETHEEMFFRHTEGPEEGAPIESEEPARES
jgi:ABC-2 type transport system ATP-binding protein